MTNFSQFEKSFETARRLQKQIEAATAGARAMQREMAEMYEQAAERARQIVSAMPRFEVPGILVNPPEITGWLDSIRKTEEMVRSLRLPEISLPAFEALRPIEPTFPSISFLALESLPTRRHPKLVERLQRRVEELERRVADLEGPPPPPETPDDPDLKTGQYL